MAEAVYVPVEKLTEFMIDALLKMGVPRADAEIVADVLLASDLYGVRSHGIAHLRWYHQRIKAGLQQAVTRWTIVNEGPTTAVIDGGNGMGMVVAFNAMKIAIEKARKYGVGGCGRSKLEPLWNRRLLLPHGGQGGDGGDELHQCPSVHCPDLWGGTDARHKPDCIQRADRRGVPFFV